MLYQLLYLAILTVLTVRPTFASKVQILSIHPLYCIFTLLVSLRYPQTAILGTLGLCRDSIHTLDFEFGFCFDIGCFIISATDFRYFSVVAVAIFDPWINSFLAVFLPRPRMEEPCQLFPGKKVIEGTQRAVRYSSYSLFLAH